MKKYDINFINNYVYEKSEGKCKVVSDEYPGIYKKMQFLCECGNLFETSFGVIKYTNKFQCNTCGFKRTADAKRLDYLDVKNYIEVESKSGCKLLTENYVRDNQKLELQCFCGNIFYTSFTNFKSKNKYKCEICLNNIIWNINKVKEYVEEYGNGCTMIDNIFVNTKTKIKFLCVCGNLFLTTFEKFRLQNQKQCQECGKSLAHKNRMHSYEYVKTYIEQNSNCKLDSKTYVGIFEKLKIKCECNNIFYASFDAIKNGKKILCCSNCSKDASRGERIISDYLIENKFEFVCQKKFNELIGVGKNLLSYDFYLPKINLLIEYQGEFHDGTAKLQNEDQYRIQKEHDNRKREYAINNNINFLEIWYWDFKNIKLILEKELNKKNTKRIRND